MLDPDPDLSQFGSTALKRINFNSGHTILLRTRQAAMGRGDITKRSLKLIIFLN
jgi:hypothetical protein